MNSPGRIILIPADLGSDDIQHVWPSANLTMIGHIRHFIVENERSARRFLRRAGFKAPFDEVTFYLLNKHTQPGEPAGFLKPAENGFDTGLLSEAGLPCIADPGQEVVAMAQRTGIRVIPLVGPSSLLLALMASGFNGQHFLFHGYLPIDRNTRIKAIREIEQAAYRLNQTQLFMETPYRNDRLMHELVTTCDPDTLLCVACDLTLPTEFIQTRRIGDWKKNMPGLNKRPGIFLLYRP